MKRKELIQILKQMPDKVKNFDVKVNIKGNKDITENLHVMESILPYKIIPGEAVVLKVLDNEI